MACRASTHRIYTSESSVDPDVLRNIRVRKKIANERVAPCQVFSPDTFYSVSIMTTEHIQFFTATILDWKQLLKPDRYKDIIVSSLKFLVVNGRASLYGFVIMPNHIHLIWQMRENNKQSDVQRIFLKYTAQQIKFDLQKNHPQVLERFRVEAKDRTYQIWEHRPLSVPIWSRGVLIQKLDYIHRNPVQEKWKLSELPETYHYSSARFYLLNCDDWGFITHYAE